MKSRWRAGYVVGLVLSFAAGLQAQQAQRPAEAVRLERERAAREAPKLAEVWH